MFLTWGVEHVEVAGGSLSDNQMIGFSLPIISDSVSLTSPLAFGVTKRRERTEIKMEEKEKNRICLSVFCNVVHKHHLTFFFVKVIFNVCLSFHLSSKSWWLS